MSLEAQLERLNTNLENLVGAIAANTSIAASLTAKPADAAPATAPAKPPKAKPQPTKTEEPKVETKEVPQAETDPFATEKTPPAADEKISLDDVREYGLKVRDEISVEAAKKLIASFGVEKLAEVPPAKYAEFVRKAIALLNPSQDI